jgi:hypothetical protein
MIMYTIELTAGLAWDAPVAEVHCVERALHIVDVERMAQALLISSRPASSRLRPTNYRILDPIGRCVRSSATAAAPKGSMCRTAARTCWV